MTTETTFSWDLKKVIWSLVLIPEFADKVGWWFSDYRIPSFGSFFIAQCNLWTTIQLWNSILQILTVLCYVRRFTFFFVSFFLFVVLILQPRASWMLGRHSTTELESHLRRLIINIRVWSRGGVITNTVCTDQHKHMAFHIECSW